MISILGGCYSSSLRTAILLLFTIARTYSAQEIDVNDVWETDTILVPASNHADMRPFIRPLIAPITGYNWDSVEQFPAHQYERPIYSTIDRFSVDFWNYLVDELLLARVDVVMLHGRGCYNASEGEDGPGDMCPRTLQRFVDAVDRAEASNLIRVGMFVDTATVRKVAGIETTMDLSDESNWVYFWDYNIKIWFDTMPQTSWYLLFGKPLIVFWTLSDRYFSNQEGNASRLLEWIEDQFVERYSVSPAFIVQDTWFESDSTLSNTKYALGKQSWFNPISNDHASVSSFVAYNGLTWGVTTPGFRDANTTAGCGSSCREVTRRSGQTLTNAMDTAESRGASLLLLEGWTDMAESAGFYRSNHWDYPNQYISLVREYADPEPETLRLQAEGADSFFDTSPENLGGTYSDRAIDVGALDDESGWFVGWIEEGEWLEYHNVLLGSGRYRFSARVATETDRTRMRLDLGGLPSVELPFTGGLDNFQVVHLGEIELERGAHNLRLVFETSGDLSVDWYFVKRTS